MRYAAGVEYDGGQYCGWQIQPAHRTVQGCVEQALTSVAGNGVPISTVCAGRTDSGVHALNQVFNFDSDAVRSEKAWLMGANAHLPVDIRLKWVLVIGDEFSARFDAEYRDYRYLIRNSRSTPAIFSARAGWWPQTLDADAMHVAAQHLLGEQDFTSFRASECQSLTAMRNVHNVVCMRRGDWLSISIRANAFLHHMVRNIVGSLALVGQGGRQAEWIAEVLLAKDRTQAGPTAPPTGLYFVSPSYPSAAGLPEWDVEQLWFDAGLPVLNVSQN